jgi:hypothetical protein
LSVESAETKNKKKEGEQKNKNTENGTHTYQKKFTKKKNKLKIHYIIISYTPG